MPAPATEILSFGPFRLIPGERALTRGGLPVELGGRSLDVLLALLARANEVVGKRELLAQVWPDVVVEEGSLRFHVASLRKALGDGIDGARYITTVAGRGYCFVASVTRSGEQAATAVLAAPVVTRIDLPGRLLRLVGRTEEIPRVAGKLLEERLVTLVGSGGVGKTTVAVAVGHELTANFAGAVLFVDLGSISDPTLIATTLATMLGLSAQNEGIVEALLAHLRDRRLLLIFDTCEHLIEAVAMLASRLFAAGPHVHILATSREALRVPNEHVFVVAPLPCPPNDPTLTLDIVETFPAAQLFLERARASGAQMELNDGAARLVADICRKLDGLALAIELAAGRVQTYGLQKTAALLDEHLSLSWPGLRTAPLRQRTLQATLDWSYELLSDTERTVLRRLAVFVGPFTFESGLRLATGDTLSEQQAFRALESLIDKSLLATHPLGGMMRYRLLDTTRAYALQADAADTERIANAARHAAYFRGRLEQLGNDPPNLSSPAERAPLMTELGNVRAALEWCFGPRGDVRIGVGLSAAAAPVFLAMSLLTECHRWSEQALSALDASTRGGIEEMRLQAGLAMALMFTRDHGDAAQAAFGRSLEIAQRRADAVNTMLLLAPLHMFHFRRGEYRSSLSFARRSASAAAESGDEAAIAVAHCLTGISLHSMGELTEARQELEAALRHEPVSHRSRTLHLGFDYYNWAGMALSRTLWMLGHADQALASARRTIEDAERLNHPVTLTIVLNWATALYLWLGDLDSAETYLDWFLSRAATYSLGPYLAVGQGLKGEIAIRRGHAAQGVELLQSALQTLHAARYELVSTSFRIALAEGLAHTGRIQEALEVIDTGIRQVELNGDFCYVPELLRVKSRLLLATTPPDPTAAQSILRQSLDWSRRQSARGWELRAAADLAALTGVAI